MGCKYVMLRARLVVMSDTWVTWVSGFDGLHCKYVMLRARLVVMSDIGTVATRYTA